MFTPLLVFSQNTYDFEGRLTSDHTLDKEGKIIVTRNYFYSSDALTHELWYNHENILAVRYNYNKEGNVSEIIKYSPWEKEVTITDREEYYYDKNNIFSIKSILSKGLYTNYIGLVIVSSWGE